MNLGGQTVDVTGFAPGQWSWATTTTGGVTATFSITTGGVYTANLLMREDGLRIDRLLLTTDTTFIPTGFGPSETERQLGTSELVTPLTRTIVYTYDHLYRLTEADYTSGQSYAYSYDSVGNRLQQIIDGDTTTYQYDAANRLEQVTVSGQSPVSYTFDDNGNLLSTGVMTNTWDAANRLTQIVNPKSSIVNRYNGVGDRVGQTTSVTTTYFALDVMGLPEVIYTTEGNLYLHLPGVIMAESGMGEIRYLLSDGLGSVRQAVDESGEVVAYNEFDPYGNPVQDDANPYGFTGEWWADDVELLHLRARWYAPETGTFLSRDSLLPMPEYTYASNNPINRVDPSGYVDWSSCVIGPEVTTCKLEFNDTLWGIAREVIYLNGNANAFNDQRINRVMVPEMQARNPNLYSASFGWDCPTCLADTINLPTAWVKGFMFIPTWSPQTPTGGPTPPSGGNPPPPLPPTHGGCDWPTPIGPIVYKIGQVDIILFPDGMPGNVPPPSVGYKNDTLAQTATGIGVLLDVFEAGSFLIPGAPEIGALADLGAAGVGSFFAGETYIGKPHPELPTMAILGQDVIVASAETAIGTIGKWSITNAGVQTGNLPVALASYLGGIGWDSGTSLTQAGYDAGRFFGKVPTVVSAGIYMEDYWPYHPRIAFMFYQP